VYVREKEWSREKVLLQQKKERERECACVCVCVWVRERERERREKRATLFRWVLMTVKFTSGAVSIINTENEPFFLFLSLSHTHTPTHTHQHTHTLFLSLSSVVVIFDDRRWWKRRSRWPTTSFACDVDGDHLSTTSKKWQYGS